MRACGVGMVLVWEGAALAVNVRRGRQLLGWGCGGGVMVFENWRGLTGGFRDVCLFGD